MIDGARVTGGALCALALGKGLFSPDISHAADVSFPESDCGTRQKDGKRILVAYASRFGSTGGVAESIGQVFCEKGETADIRYIRNISDSPPFRGVLALCIPGFVEICCDYW